MFKHLQAMVILRLRLNIQTMNENGFIILESFRWNFSAGNNIQEIPLEKGFPAPFSSGKIQQNFWQIPGGNRISGGYSNVRKKSLFVVYGS